MKHITRFIMAVTLLCLSSVTSPALAAGNVPAFLNETPLIVIRFNELRVDYPTPLYNAISQALKVKPSAVFDVVSIAPRAQAPRNQPYYNDITAQNTHKVLTTLHEIGLPANRISLTQAIDTVSASEVRIFVH